MTYTYVDRMADEALQYHMDRTPLYGSDVKEFGVVGDFGAITIRTNGFKGGDAGHGGVTEIQLEGYCVAPTPMDRMRDLDYDHAQIFRVKGDVELQQIIKSLEVLNEAMKKEFNTEGWLP